MNDTATKNLIKELTSGLEPLKPQAHPFIRIMPWMFVVLVYTVVVINYLGLRPDLRAVFESLPFLFETGLVFLLGLSAALASSWLCVPDMRGQKWLLAVPLTLALVFALWSGLRAFAEGLYMPEFHWDHCFNDAMLVGFVPAAVIVFVTRKGKTTRPLTMSLMNILAVSAFGYIGLRLTCMLDTVGHACLYHLFPFVVFGALLGAVARCVYRW